MRQEYEAQIETLKKEQKHRIEEGKDPGDLVVVVTIVRPSLKYFIVFREKVSPAQVVGRDGATPS